MDKVYMVCDFYDGKAASIDSAPNIGVEFMGNCSGRILREDGSKIGGHYSSSFGWLRNDLKNKLDDPSKYEIIVCDEQISPIDYNLKVVLTAAALDATIPTALVPPPIGASSTFTQQA